MSAIEKYAAALEERVLERVDAEHLKENGKEILEQALAKVAELQIRSMAGEDADTIERLYRGVKAAFSNLASATSGTVVEAVRGVLSDVSMKVLTTVLRAL